MENKFTIIIPTRERCSVLYHTIRTCLAIDYNNYEILVSDNFSSDKTREVVERFDSEKIRYVNTGKRISMAENWEFALKHLRGDSYVTVLGDDDGMLPGSLIYANDIINQTSTQALTWRKIEYCWPNHLSAIHRGFLAIPFKHGWSEVDSAQSLRELCESKRKGYAYLPSLYNSFVSSRCVSEALNECSQKTFFNFRTPDLYSGIVVALFTDSYVYSCAPLSVNGGSKFSNGTAHAVKDSEEAAKIASIFDEEIKNSDQHVDVFKYQHGIPGEVYTALNLLKATYPVHAKGLDLDRQLFVQRMALWDTKFSKAEPYFVDLINELLDFAGCDETRQVVRDISNTVFEEHRNPCKVNYGISTESVRFNSQYLMVRDVYGAARLSSIILAIIMRVRALMKVPGLHLLFRVFKSTLRFVRRRV